MLDGGYIKLHRSILKWEWYGKRTVRELFIHLLLTANYEPQKWQGIVIERGQRAYSRASLSAETGLSEQEVRTAISKLLSTGEITSQKHPQSAVLTVVHYDNYQQSTSQSTSEQPSSNQAATSDQPVCKKDKESKKEKEETPPLPPTGFESFWSAYPKKKSKTDAVKAWEKLKPDCELVAIILQKVAQAKTSQEWRKADGQYIPYPATYLNGKRWEDESETGGYNYEDDGESL